LTIDAATQRRRRIILAFATAIFLIHFATDGRYGYFRDELYFLDCTHHLDWGYVDFAPLTIWVLRVVVATLGDSLHAIRLLPALAAAGKVVLTGLLAVELGADAFGIGLACLCVIAAPVYLVIDNQFAGNTFESVIWMGIAYLLIRAIKDDRPRLLIWIGLLVGIGVENKLSMLFFCAAMLVGLLLTPSRRLLRGSSIWIAIALAAMCVLPTLVWQCRHDWAMWQVESTIRRMHKDEPLSAPGFLLHQLMMLVPASALVWIPGLIFLLRDVRLRAFGYAYLILLAIMMMLGAKDYYLAPMYPLLFAAGAAFWSEMFRTGRLNWMRYGIPALVVIGGMISAPLALPILSPEDLISYEVILHQRNPHSQTGQEGVLPEHFGDEFGWREMSAAVAGVYDALPPDERGKTAIFAKNYGEAGAIDFFGPALELPHAISPHQNYWLWGPDDYRGDVIIALQYSRDELMKMGCASVEDGPMVDNPYSMAEEHFRIEVCRDLRPPLPEQWRALKRWY
jgi:dolichyl-phosphate-mannose-protein mannosyltransferase